VSLLNRLTPREPILRHRGAHRDENGVFTADGQPVTILAIAVAPGGGSDRSDRSRTGEDIDCTVYFPPGTDVVSSDELTVRGKRFRIIVNDWHIDDTTTGGLEVLCVRSQG